MSVETRDKKQARRGFADGACVRIANKMHDSLRRGIPVTPEMYRRWWNEEAKVAKAGGLYSMATFYHDAASGLMSMAEERGYVQPTGAHP